MGDELIKYKRECTTEIYWGGFDYVGRINKDQSQNFYMKKDWMSEKVKLVRSSKRKGWEQKAMSESVHKCGRSIFFTTLLFLNVALYCLL